MNRRELLRAHAAAVAALAAGIVLPAAAQPVPGGIESLKIKWSKAPCRFCGTGCGVMVGVKDDRVVATHGDMLAEVNRGLNCVKGYFLSKIMYGADRLTQPLLRKRDGRYAKDGVFTPVTWDEVERAYKKKDAGVLVFEAPQVVARVEKLGDLFEPVLELKQRLPDLKGAVAEEPKRIEIAAQAEEEDPPRKTSGKKPMRKGPAGKKRGKV